MRLICTWSWMGWTWAEQLCAQSGSPDRGTEAEVDHWGAVSSTSLAMHMWGGQNFPLCMYGELPGLVTGTNVIATKDMTWPYSPGTVTGHRGHRSQHTTAQSHLLQLWQLVTYRQTLEDKIRIQSNLGKLERWSEIFKMKCNKGQRNVLDLLRRI